MLKSTFESRNLTSRLVEFFGDPSLHLELSNQWRAQDRVRFREDIRAALMAKLISQGYRPPQNILELTQVPSSDQVSISISHCLTLGGFGWVKRPCQVGLDVEQRDRIKPRIVQRVSTAEEVSSAPFMEFLWVAKESVFKATLGLCQPSVISEIRIFNWEFLASSHIMTFNASLERDSQLLHRSLGVIACDQQTLIALFLVSPSNFGLEPPIGRYNA